MGNENDRNQAEFNMAVSYLNRMNVLFSIADDAAMQLDAYTWFHSLLVLRRELSTEMNSKETDNLKQMKTKIQPLVESAVQRTNKTGQSEISSELYDLLDNFELELRRILKASGLQMKMQDDAMKALK